jgi:NAD(P)-dependent dehydrogenase (short-subunit alcohol dehydrogenase family)
MKLLGKVAIVTGATHGIGLATARLFASEGAATVLAGRSRRDGDAAAKSILDEGGRALFVETDVSSSRDVSALVAATLAEFGGIDILVNNAGIEIGKPLLETTEEEWDRLLAVNLKGHFLCATAVVPSMRARGGGSIVNTSSVLAVSTMHGCGAYSTSKAGILGLTRSMAFEWAPLGIRVNGVLPGSTDTDMMWFGIPEDELEDRRQAEEDVLPLGRVGRPDEIAQATLWFCTEAASFATGSLLVVDGGALTEYPSPRWHSSHAAASL